MKGITVTLYEKVEVGRDGFNHPIYEETPVEVGNVLVAPLSVTEALETTNLIGKKALFQIAIPKGDTHTWSDRKVRFFDSDWLVIGFPKMGIEKNIPTKWHHIYQVAKYE